MRLYLVQATTLPGLNGCFAKAKVGIEGLGEACLLFEPDHKTLGDSGSLCLSPWFLLTAADMLLYLYITTKGIV